MPPRTTEKSHRPRASDRTMVDTCSAHPIWLAQRLSARPGLLRAVLDNAFQQEESQAVEIIGRLNASPWSAVTPAPHRTATHQQNSACRAECHGHFLSGLSSEGRYFS